MPSLCSSAPTVRPGVSRSMRNAENFSTPAFQIQDFGEDRIEVGDSAVGGPHFFAVERVVLAVWRERGAAADVHGVRAGAGFRERVGGDPLAAGEFGQVALLLVFGSVPDERQRRDAGVRRRRRWETLARIDR